MTTVSKNRFPVFGLFTAPPVRGLCPKGRYHTSYAVHRAPNTKKNHSASFTPSRWTISHLGGRISSGSLARRHEHETSPVLPCTKRRQAHGSSRTIFSVRASTRTGRAISRPPLVIHLQRRTLGFMTSPANGAHDCAPLCLPWFSRPIPFDFPTPACH